jgi:hypothetical protein
MYGLEEEGVIQFKVDHRVVALDPQVYDAIARPLIAWRQRLVQAGLVGCDPNRYGGIGFGNLSGRVQRFAGAPGARAFLITGTQTAGRPFVTLADLCVVTRYDPERNWVESFGMIRPSSESMTHGVLYDADPSIRFVFHGHSAAIWAQAQALGLPVTDPAAGYGTPDMCREVQWLLRDPEVFQGRILVMGGHRDGVLAFGETADEAGRALLDLLSRGKRGRGKRVA